MPAERDPSSPALQSSDYEAMLPDLTLIADIREGARTIRSKGEDYLPKYENETEGGYKWRLATTPWRPEFVDGLNTLSSKPFTKPVRINDDAPDAIQGELIAPDSKQRSGGFIDDVDGLGNNLHVFSREFFRNAIADGLNIILVDYPDMNPDLTLADERASGARPYWCEIRLADVIALYYTTINGRHVVSHMRVLETQVELDGFEEVYTECVRVYALVPPGEVSKTLTISGVIVAPGKPYWELYEEVVTEEPLTKKKTTSMALVDDGPITLDEIPVVLYFTGERVPKTQYQVKSPLVDLAQTQLELYRSMSRKEEIMTYAGSPMLKMMGMKKPAPTKSETGEDIPAPRVTVGPKTIIWCPPSMDGVQSDADFIQPNSANITEVRNDVNDIMRDMQRMALQPTMPNTGAMTATVGAIDAAKSHSAIEAWANGLKDALDQAFKFTCQWLHISDTITTSVHTDFGVGKQSTEEGRLLLDGANPGAGKRSVISGETVRAEWRRRGLLGPDNDEDEELERMAEEEANDPTEQPQTLDPFTGLPIESPEGVGDGTGTGDPPGGPGDNEEEEEE